MKSFDSLSLSGFNNGSTISSPSSAKSSFSNNLSNGSSVRSSFSNNNNNNNNNNNIIVPKSLNNRRPQLGLSKGTIVSATANNNDPFKKTQRKRNERKTRKRKH
jgi:hypothetical protein